MESGSAYRFAWPYILVDVRGKKKNRHEKKAKRVDGLPFSIPTIRHDSEGGSSVASKTSDSLLHEPTEATEHTSEAATASTTLLIPLAQDPHRPKIVDEEANQKGDGSEPKKVNISATMSS